MRDEGLLAIVSQGFIHHSRFITPKKLVLFLETFWEYFGCKRILGDSPGSISVIGNQWSVIGSPITVYCLPITALHSAKNLHHTLAVHSAMVCLYDCRRRRRLASVGEFRWYLRR